MLVTYCFKYVDDDQALMWYGTVHFAHGYFPEPCFFGQSYSSMLESLLSVPLYLCGWPLNYAMPLVVSATVIFAFVYCSIDCYKRKRTVEAYMVGFLFAIVSWKWDLLTSVPHAIISGFPWAIIGVGLMCKPNNCKIKLFLGSCLCTLGAVITMSAAAIVGIAWLDYILKNGKKIKNYVVPALGVLPGAFLYVFERWYYSKHVGDIVIKSDVDFFNKEAFMHSVNNLPQLFKDVFGFGYIGIVIVPVSIIAISIVLCYKREWKKMILILAAIIGSVFALSFGWMMVYDEECVLLPQFRMVMFWVFLVLELILLFSFDKGAYVESIKDGRICILLTAVIFGFTIGKTLLFTKEIKNTDSTVYKSGIVSVMSVDELETQSKTIVEVAESLDADILVTTAYSRVMAYGASALFYDDTKVFYVPDQDRRVWVYDDLLKRRSSRLLLYSMPVTGNVELSVVELEDKTVPDYFEEKYGIVRGGKYIWGIR